MLRIKLSIGMIRRYGNLASKLVIAIPLLTSLLLISLSFGGIASAQNSMGLAPAQSFLNREDGCNGSLETKENISIFPNIGTLIAEPSGHLDLEAVQGIWSGLQKAVHLQEGGGYGKIVTHSDLQELREKLTSRYLTQFNAFSQAQNAVNRSRPGSRAQRAALEQLKQQGDFIRDAIDVLARAKNPSAVDAPLIETFFGLLILAEPKADFDAKVQGGSVAAFLKIMVRQLDALQAVPNLAKHRTSGENEEYRRLIQVFIVYLAKHDPDLFAKLIIEDLNSGSGAQAGNGDALNELLYQARGRALSDQMYALISELKAARIANENPKSTAPKASLLSQGIQAADFVDKTVTVLTKIVQLAALI